MFRSALRYLKFKPADGLRVVARGKISVYEPKGEYQLVCEHLEPQGLGALQLAFDQLKKRLQDEGPVRRRRASGRCRRCRARSASSPRSTAPRSATSSRCSRRRYRERAARHSAGARAGRGRGARDRPRPAARSAACPASTSSSSAAAADRSRISGRSTRRSSRARSPGSPVPVISAVGHETDVTIADFVADSARRRRRRPPRSSSPRRTSSAAGSIGCAIALRAAARGRVQRLEPARARRSAAGRRSPAFRAASRCAAATRRADARARARRCAPASRRASAALQQLRRQLDDLRSRAAGSRASARGWSAADGRLTGAVDAAAPSRRRAAAATAPAGSRRSARSPCSAAATRCAGTRTHARDPRRGRRSHPAIACG